MLHQVYQIVSGSHLVEQRHAWRHQGGLRGRAWPGVATGSIATDGKITIVGNGQYGAGWCAEVLASGKMGWRWGGIAPHTVRTFSIWGECVEPRIQTHVEPCCTHARARARAFSPR